ncbi:unnamed protein product [Spirodela intermedia]|uniref:Uncharacterized protein n=1 Tax=Spirodela intermedia TaxID=51605 RepID=A0ABN7E7U7_SPIIN|nr:unnamed protein product [Spirodela intermedia]
MATACKTPVAAAAAVLLLLIVAVAVAPASASSMTGYSQSGCMGTAERGAWCVLQPRRLQGRLLLRLLGGQVGRLYRGSNCQGSYDSVGRDVRRCSPYAYNSFRIMC